MDLFSNDNEVKVFILYLMERIGYPLRLEDICTILYQENIASYFGCADCFTKLIEAGHLVEKGKDENGYSLYVVSETGHRIADGLNDTLPSVIKEMSYRSAIRHLSFQRRGATLDCNAQKRKNGKYYVHCEIREHGTLVLDINVEVDTELEANKMLYNFRRRPEIVFQGTLALVSGERNYIFE